MLQLFLVKSRAACPLGQLLHSQMHSSFVLCTYLFQQVASRPATQTITVRFVVFGSRTALDIGRTLLCMGKTKEWTEQFVSVQERERRGGKICLCEVANCCLAASAWPECTQVNVSWSEHCERVLQNSAMLWQLNCSCQHFLCAFVRCVCLNLCSAGIEKVKKVVNVVSHNLLVGQLQQLVSNFHDAPMLLVAALNHLSCKNRGFSSYKKELLNANYPNMAPCATSLCKREKWNPHKGSKPNTNKSPRLWASLCPGLPLE